MPRKLPYLQLYTGDWIRDTRILSLEARAIWIDLLCLMHNSVRRGYLQAANGKPFSPEQIASHAGCSAEVASRALRELIDSGVASCTDSGVLYSRRMVRDERKRHLCSEAGKKGGGNPTLKGHPKVTPKVTPKAPMECVCETDSLNLPKRKGGVGGREAEGFAEFWAAYPRKQKRIPALKIWNRLKPSPELRATMLAALETQKQSDQWRRNVIPHATTWLNEQRWEDEPHGPSRNGHAGGALQQTASALSLFLEGEP